jgi:hypothetical protein
MREVDITLTSGKTISGIVTRSGQIWSPLGDRLTQDMIVGMKSADTDGYDEWSARIARMGRKVQREAIASRWTTRQLASGGRWS